MEIRDVLLCAEDDMDEDDTQMYQTPGTSVFSADSDQTSLKQSISSEQGVSERQTADPEQVTKTRATASQPEPKKDATQMQSKPSVMTNIRGILSHQKEKTKRKSSKTPEKEKGPKLQKQHKGGK